MRYRMIVIAVIVSIVTPNLLILSRSHLTQPLLAQPSGSISINNTQSNLTATGTIVDDSAWPIVVVQLENNHSFWLKVWIQPTPFDVQVLTDDPRTNTWARLGYTPPYAAAIYVVRFDTGIDSDLQFFVNAAQTHDGSMPAAAVTVLQRTIDTILIGVGSSTRFQDASLQTLLDSIDQLNQLPDCVDAVESILRRNVFGMPVFLSKFQTCLTDPKQAAVLAAMASQFSVQVSAETLKNFVFTPLKLLELTSQVLDTLVAIGTGSIAGTIVFESRIALPPPVTEPPVTEPPDPSQTSYVDILALACPGTPEISFNITIMAFVTDAPGCESPTVSITIADAAGTVTTYEVVGYLALDLPAGSYTITDNGSGESATFELPLVDDRETQPPECVGRAGCMSIVISLPMDQPTSSIVGLTYAPVSGDVFPSTDGIWLVDEHVSASQVVEGAVYSPAWSRDGSRLAYIRADGPGGSGATQIEVVNADGSGQTVVVPPRESPRQGSGVTAYVGYFSVQWSADDTALYYNWGFGIRGGKGLTRYDLETGQEEDVTATDVYFGADFDVATDGTIVALGDPGGPAGELNLYLITDQGELQLLRDMTTASSYSDVAWSPDGNQIALELDGSLSIIARDGTTLQQVVAGDVDGITWSPDGSSLAYTTTASTADGIVPPMVWTVPAAGGTPTEHFAGTYPTWRSTGSQGMTAPVVDSEAEIAPSVVDDASLPEAYFGTWSGQGIQVNPTVEWPVTVTLGEGMVTKVVGTTDYPSDGCGGELFLEEVRTDAIVLRENLTYGEGACTDDGTITLTLQPNNTLGFDWSGIRADGSASTATGTLSAAETPSDAVEAPADDEPVEEIASTLVPDTYLGMWAGMGIQVNPSVEWPVTIRIGGGTVGSVVGNAEYPEDGCGGDLILQEITTGTLVLLEDLTYGEENCTDGGTITLEVQADGTLAFDWVGIRADGSSTSATGLLSRGGS